MLQFIKNELAKFNIELVSSLSLEECKITRPYLLERCGIESGSAIIFTVPYLTSVSAGERNISSYSVSRDYHFFFANLFDTLIPILKEMYPNNKFAGFTDHSPIDEIHASAISGLGVIGKNHLLITEKYSSYIFIGEILTDAILPSSAGEIKECVNCGKCLLACPVSMEIGRCLSALTQKKGELTDSEKEAIKSHNCAWGCDRCQECCPYTVKAKANGTIYSKIAFFNEALTPTLTSELVENMSDEEFKHRAYSWRGKKTVLRNLEILEGKEK
ncbi:MAG: epoxyqueuosine reductase [Clostridia bacterium]|nr:epoxyqueuosine reductase [Clostridia bacterium]